MSIYSGFVFYGNIAAVAVTAVLIGVIWRNRDVPGTTGLLVAAVGVVVWASTYTLSLSAADIAAKVFWFRTQQFGEVFGLVGWLMFAGEYTDREWVLEWRYLLPVIAVSLLAVPVSWTNRTPGWSGFHDLWWRSVTTTSVGGLAVLTPTRGPLFWAYTAVTSLIFVGGAYFLFEFTIRPEQRLYLRQNLTIVLGAFFAFLLSVLFRLAGQPLDPTPIGMGVVVVAVMAALLGEGFFDVVPLARRSFIEEIEGGVLVYDDDHRIVDVNEFAETVLATDDESLVGRGVTEVVASHVPVDESDDPVQEVLDGKDVVVDRDGDRRYFQLRVSTLTDASGTELGHAVLLYDVTEQRRTQRELQRQNEHLSQFASVVTHDLRNPLNVASGRLALLAEDCDSEHVEAIERSLDRMSALVDDVLTLAKQGQTVDELERVESDRLIEEAWHHVDTDGVRLDARYEETVLADESRTLSLLENLFRNAIEHGDADVIRVGPLDGDASSGFYVADDGTGIPEAERKRVFDSGFTTSEEGTGLGLYLVREIAQAQGWDVDVTESEWGGARFEMRSVERG